MPPDLLITGGKNERLADNDSGNSNRLGFTVSWTREAKIMDWLMLLAGAFICGMLIGELVRQWRKK